MKIVWAPRKLSLRVRILFPLLTVSATAAIVVAILSSWVGRQWAMQDVQERFEAIEQTVQQASFPLTSSVLSSLAKLSGSELIVVDNTGDLVASTIDSSSDRLTKNGFELDNNPDRNSGRDSNSSDDSRSEWEAENTVRQSVRVLANRLGVESSDAVEHRLGASSYFALSIRPPSDPFRPDSGNQVIVLFETARVHAAGRRAGLAPLVTGLSTIVLLTTLMSFITGRLAGRLAKLQRRVEKVADGDFQSLVADETTDEVGLLGQSVDKMAKQLHQLWQQFHRQQSQRLLHQLAGGMAHQLRNTLTGARLALELHRQNCPLEDKQDVDVSLREMEGAEDYVRRILLVGAGEQKNNEAARITTCLHHVCVSHAAVAKHLRVSLDWDIEAVSVDAWVADGSTFSAAISNLVLNALQAAGKVQVQASMGGATNGSVEATICKVAVRDDGPGISAAVAEQLFEPFFTTKSEGLGLGLPLVRRAAEKLSGRVEWRREGEFTVFEFHCKVSICPS